MLDLSVDKYDKFRALTGPEIVSHYNTVMKYRDSVVLPQIQTTDNSCIVTLREMVHNTVKRLLQYLADKTDVLCGLSEEDRHSVLLIAKLGSDGQADQANYKTCETMTGNVSDSAAFSVGFVVAYSIFSVGAILVEKFAKQNCRILEFSKNQKNGDFVRQNLALRLRL